MQQIKCLLFEKTYKTSPVDTSSENEGRYFKRCKYLSTNSIINMNASSSSINTFDGLK